MLSRSVAAFLLVALPLASAGNAVASSCVDPVAAAIHFQKGKSCWVYEGKATEFTGKFAGGQQVSATMYGLAYSANSGSAADEDLTVTWEARSPEINGPGNFYYDSTDEPGSVSTTLPAGGTYTFGFSPCAMWHAYGRVVICAH
jgi:hypothetical protein